MGKLWYLLSFAFILAIDIILFYFVPNGILITLATMIYVLWWIGFKEKTQYLLIPIVVLVVAFVFVALPVLHYTGFNEDVAFFANMYSLIYPSGFSYSWQTQTPEIIMETLALTISFILATKLVIWMIGQFYRKISKKNFVVALSRFLTYILIFYTFMNLFPALLGDSFLESYRSFFALSLFYDIMFVWIPFVIIFFFIDFLIYHFRGGD
jgi:hypothetical protein